MCFPKRRTGRKEIFLSSCFITIQNLVAVQKICGGSCDRGCIWPSRTTPLLHVLSWRIWSLCVKRYIWVKVGSPVPIGPKTRIMGHILNLRPHVSYYSQVLSGYNDNKWLITLEKTLSIFKPKIVKLRIFLKSTWIICPFLLEFCNIM